DALPPSRLLIAPSACAPAFQLHVGDDVLARKRREAGPVAALHNDHRADARTHPQESVASIAVGDREPWQRTAALLADLQPDTERRPAVGIQHAAADVRQ